jgi:3-deoxy-D-manno-octulosonic-acid transferase
MRPDLLIFSRGDLWPATIQHTAALDVPIAVVGGTVGPSSRRLWPPIQRALRPTYNTIDWIGAVSQGDADRLISLGARENVVVVTGDPRNDQVLERNCDLGVVSLIAPNGEGPDTRLMLVPHDISVDRVSQILATAHRHSVSVEVWNGRPPRGQSRCVIVQKTGVLADLYALAGLAYVGGGFGHRGLHAVIEPAAFAVPIIVGPEHEDSQACKLLLEADGAIALPKRGATDRLRQVWIDWVSNSRQRTEIGIRARSTLRQGAATTSAVALLQLISRSNAEHL